MEESRIQITYSYHWLTTAATSLPNLCDKSQSSTSNKRQHLWDLKEFVSPLYKTNNYIGVIWMHYLWYTFEQQHLSNVHLHTLWYACELKLKHHHQLQLWTFWWSVKTRAILTLNNDLWKWFNSTYFTLLPAHHQSFLSASPKPFIFLLTVWQAFDHLYFLLPTGRLLQTKTSCSNPMFPYID